MQLSSENLVRLLKRGGGSGSGSRTVIYVAIDRLVVAGLIHWTISVMRNGSHTHVVGGPDIGVSTGCPVTLDQLIGRICGGAFGVRVDNAPSDVSQ